jgi:hypothetical protein
MPDSVDLSAAWQFTAIHDDVKAKEFEKRFGVKLTSKFRHVPDSFARLLAKIAYCHTLCVLDPGDFRPICLPYILGEKRNPSYIVGGTFDIAPPEPGLGYALNTFGFAGADRLMLLAEIRLYANLHAPTYHVVVGDIWGAEKIAAALKKIGPITILGIQSGLPPDDDSHWMPRVWPLAVLGGLAQPKPVTGASLAEAGEPHSQRYQGQQIDFSVVAYANCRRPPAVTSIGAAARSQ